jgi:4-aminobutyrate aminotransferase
MLAVEFVDPADGRPSPALASKMMEETRTRGLLVGKGGLLGNAIRMAPPLTLTAEEADEGLEILRAALTAL